VSMNSGVSGMRILARVYVRTSEHWGLLASLWLPSNCFCAGLDMERSRANSLADFLFNIVRLSPLLQEAEIATRLR